VTDTPLCNFCSWHSVVKTPKNQNTLLQFVRMKHWAELTLLQQLASRVSNATPRGTRDAQILPKTIRTAHITSYVSPWWDRPNHSSVGPSHRQVSLMILLRWLQILNFVPNCEGLHFFCRPSDYGTMQCVIM